MENNSTDISHLVALCREQDRQAQFELYNRYYKAMYNTALRIVKDVHWAEDIMQESFLKAFTKLDSFKGEVTFGAWLKKIVVNHSIDTYKKTNQNACGSLEEMLYKIEDEPTDGQGVDFTDIKVRQIVDCMKTLKDNYRIALTLLYIEGYDQDEISGIMAISPGNCRTLISRAKESLRHKIQIA